VDFANFVLPQCLHQIPFVVIHPFDFGVHFRLFHSLYCNYLEKEGEKEEMGNENEFNANLPIFDLVLLRYI